MNHWHVEADTGAGPGVCLCSVAYPIPAHSESFSPRLQGSTQSTNQSLCPAGCPTLGQEEGGIQGSERCCPLINSDTGGRVSYSHYHDHELTLRAAYGSAHFIVLSDRPTTSVPSWNQGSGECPSLAEQPRSTLRLRCCSFLPPSLCPPLLATWGALSFLPLPAQTLLALQCPAHPASNLPRFPFWKAFCPLRSFHPTLHPTCSV